MQWGTRSAEPIREQKLKIKIKNKKKRRKRKPGGNLGVEEIQENPTANLKRFSRDAHEGGLEGLLNLGRKLGKEAVDVALLGNLDCRAQSEQHLADGILQAIITACGAHGGQLAQFL